MVGETRCIMTLETVNIIEAKYVLDPVAFCSKQSASWWYSMIG